MKNNKDIKKEGILEDFTEDIKEDENAVLSFLNYIIGSEDIIDVAFLKDIKNCKNEKEARIKFIKWNGQIQQIIRKKIRRTFND